MNNAFPKATWRLILSEPLPGAMNMAIDSAILAAVEEGISPPTLRLYSWNPPCLSLGYNQPYSDVDLDQLTARKWDVVRRPTGGRAILHTDELTYAVIGPKSDPRLAGSLMNSYQNISQALFSALSQLGLPVEVHAGKNPQAHHQPVCFENPSDFEITANGKKIIGSAQARKKNCLLQHGSLPLSGDLTRITRVLSYPSLEARQMAGELILQKGVTVAQVLGEVISWTRASQAYQAGFSQTLNILLEEGELTSLEMTNAQRLVSDKYSHPDWMRGSSPTKAAN
jgi:lipoate-protein ligase A